MENGKNKFWTPTTIPSWKFGRIASNPSFFYHRQTDKQTDKQTDRQTGRQTDRQTDRQTNKQTNKQTEGQIT